jgi:ATP-dependent protease HslVU (ClpYQ) peptidase subunit
MTCIVALKDGKGGVVMGGDSAGVAGLDIRIRRDPKVAQVGEFLIGYTSSFRMGQLLFHKFTPPAIYRGEDLYHYMVARFTESVRKTFKRGGFSKIGENEEEGGTFIVAVQGRIFTLQNDFQVAECHEDFTAVGCGESYALAAFRTMEMLKDRRPARSRVLTALKVAVEYSAGVRPPFVILPEK